MTPADLTELEAELLDPEYAGPFQHCRPSIEIDRLFKQSADAIADLQRQLAEARAERDRAALVAADEANRYATLSACLEAKPVVKALEWEEDHGVAGLGPYRLFKAETPLGRFAYGTDAEGAAYYHTASSGVMMVGDEATARRLAETSWEKAALAEVAKFAAPAPATLAQGSMDVLEAMRITVALSNPFAPVGDISSLSHPHLVEMLATMESGGFSYGKACRWLGWAQAAVVANGNADLDTMKAINKRCQRAAAPAQEVPYGDGYCTDCENRTVIHDGRCACGSGRVIADDLAALSAPSTPPEGWRLDCARGEEP